MPAQQGLYPRRYLETIEGSSLDRIAEAAAELDVRARAAEDLVRGAREHAAFLNTPVNRHDPANGDRNVAAANAVWHALGDHEQARSLDCWECQRRLTSV